MAEIKLEALDRPEIGSRPARRLRRQGKVPAIVYGSDLSPIPISVDHHEVEMVLNTEAGTNAIINLEIEGSESVLTMARQVERHPFRNQIRHIDFVKVSLTETVTVSVGVTPIGEAIGVKEGGILSLVRNQVEIETLPTTIPPVIEADVTDLAIGHSLRIGDLPKLEGISYLEDEDRVVVTVTAPTVEVEPTVVEEGVEAEEVEAPVTEVTDTGEAAGEDTGPA